MRPATPQDGDIGADVDRLARNLFDRYWSVYVTMGSEPTIAARKDQAVFWQVVVQEGSPPPWRKRIQAQFNGPTLAAALTAAQAVLDPHNGGSGGRT